MSNYIYNLFAIVSGAILGLIYFGSLLFQLKKFVNLKSSFYMIIGFFLRFLFMGICLFILIKYAKLLQIILFLIGFIIILICMIFKLKSTKNYEN